MMLKNFELVKIVLQTIYDILELGEELFGKDTNEFSMQFEENGGIGDLEELQFGNDIRPVEI